MIFRFASCFCVLICSSANRQRTLILYFRVLYHFVFYRPATGEITWVFRAASRQLATCEIQCLISTSRLFFRLRLTWWWQHFGASTGNTNPGSVRPSPPDIIRLDTIGRSAELNSLHPVVHHIVESARPAWQDPVYVSKLVDIVYIRVNWPVLLSVEWSAISRPFFGHLCVTICLSTLGRVVSQSTTPSLILCVQVSLSTLGRVVSQLHVTIVHHLFIV